MSDSPFIIPQSYIAIQIKAEPAQQELLIGLLSIWPFEGFQEGPEHLEAYIPASAFDAEALQNHLDSLPGGPYLLTHKVIPPQNWNETWEAHYPPVEVDSFCQIVPHFHMPRPDFTYTIRITPQMSFGTGHHETTRLMIGLLANIEVENKAVLDMGSGTGVLGILTALQGAQHVLGIDIDQWSMENGRENILRNGVESKMDMMLGDAQTIPKHAVYDIVLANINRNVLLQDLPAYASHMRTGGNLLLSGFLQADQERMLAALEAQGLKLLDMQQEGDWIALHAGLPA
ncbi:MAG: 50S ribosomal protein L11 methyltransferase [Bacteroidota bacterium]